MTDALTLRDAAIARAESAFAAAVKALDLECAAAIDRANRARTQGYRAAVNARTVAISRAYARADEAMEVAMVET